MTIHVHDLKTLRLPEVDAEFLESIGFESEDELRDALREVLVRRVSFQQRQAVRSQIVAQLADQTPFDLPADLVARQERSTLRRQVDEMKSNGMSEAEIRAREAEIRANAHESTLRSLKEFFLLSRIAEEEGIKVEDDDVEGEIYEIARRTEETPRRVRARIRARGARRGARVANPGAEDARPDLGVHQGRGRGPDGREGGRDPRRDRRAPPASRSPRPRSRSSPSPSQPPE